MDIILVALFSIILASVALVIRHKMFDSWLLVCVVVVIGSIFSSVIIEAIAIPLGIHDGSRDALYLVGAAIVSLITLAISSLVIGLYYMTKKKQVKSG